MVFFAIAVLLICRIIMEFPGLVERRRKVSRRIRKISVRLRKGEEEYDPETGELEHEQVIEDELPLREKEEREKMNDMKDNVRVAIQGKSSNLRSSHHSLRMSTESVKNKRRNHKLKGDESPRLERRAKFRDSMKKTKERVRKISNDFSLRKVKSSDSGIEEENSEKPKKERLQQVIRITPSIRGSLRISRDFVRKISMRKKSDAENTTEQDDSGQSESKSRKTGVCLVYYSPDEESEGKGKEIKVVPLSDCNTVIEIGDSSTLEAPKNTQRKDKLSSPATAVLKESSTSLAVLEESC